jgi:hypothetical protein
MEKNRSEKGIVIASLALLILSLLDGALTLRGLKLGAIEEVNPVMLWLIEKSPIAFMASKVLLPVMLWLVFWQIRNRSRKLVRYGFGVVLIIRLNPTLCVGELKQGNRYL